MLFLFDLALGMLFCWIGQLWLLGLVGVLALAEYAWLNNQMMIAVEHHLYDK